MTLTASQRIAARWIPDGAIEADNEGTDATVYRYDRLGKLYAVAYHGTSRRADWHFQFASAERRDEKIAAFLDSRRAHAKYKAERKADDNKPHTVKTGDIFYTSWGYDQTNVEYFEITGLIGKTMVELRELKRSREETGFMSGNSVPLPGQFDGEPIRRKVNTRYKTSIKIDDCRTAWLWDGRPKSWSSYA